MMNKQNKIMFFASLLPTLGRAFSAVLPHLPTILPTIGSAVSTIFGKDKSKSSSSVPSVAPIIPSGLGTASSFRRYDMDIPMQPREPEDEAPRSGNMLHRIRDVADMVSKGASTIDKIRRATSSDINERRSVYQGGYRQDGRLRGLRPEFFTDADTGELDEERFASADRVFDERPRITSSVRSVALQPYGPEVRSRFQPRIQPLQDALRQPFFQPPSQTQPGLRSQTVLRGGRRMPAFMRR